MPINVIGITSGYTEKIATALFVQNPYLGINYFESNIEKDIDLKTQYRIKKLKDPISIKEAVSKNYVDTLFSYPSKLKHFAQVDFKKN